jgi:hypothetical protein
MYQIEAFLADNASTANILPGSLFLFQDEHLVAKLG